MNKKYQNAIEKEEICAGLPEESHSLLKTSFEIVKKPGSPVAVTFNEEEWLSYANVTSLVRRQEGWFFTLSNGARLKSVIPDEKFDGFNEDVNYLFLCPLNDNGVGSPLLVPMIDERIKLNFKKIK